MRYGMNDEIHFVELVYAGQEISGKTETSFTTSVSV